MKKCFNCGKVYSDEIMYCEQCGNKVNALVVNDTVNESKKNNTYKKPKSRIGLIWLCIIEAVLLVVAVPMCIYFANECSYYRRSVSDKHEDYYSLQKEYDVLNEKYESIVEDYDLYYENVALIDQYNKSGTSNDGYYHKADCENCEFEFISVYLEKRAKEEGYTACPNCW